MIKQLSKTEAANLLNQPCVSSFWLELGEIVELPDDFIFLLIDDCLFVIEHVDKYFGIHVAINPNLRGAPAVKAGRKAIAWCLERRKKVLARIMKDQKQVRAFAVACGMTKYSETDTHIFYEALPCQ